MFCPPSLGAITSITTVPTPVIVAAGDAALARMMDMALRMEGYDPKVYTDGRQALNALMAEPCAAAVVDVHLPTIDGLAICEDVRTSTSPVSSLPIILLLVQEDAPVWQAHSHRLRVNAGLFIPFQLSQLILAVASAIRDGQPQFQDPIE
jgi:two-component system response regulator MprA